MSKLHTTPSTLWSCILLCLTLNTFSASAQPVGNPADFGNNGWNVYVWNSGGSTITTGTWNTDYFGYHTSSKLNINSTLDWDVYNNPSFAANYQGLEINDSDNFSYSYKRRGFSAGNYILNVEGHDDAAELWVNGIKVWFSNACCTTQNAAWTGTLGAASTVVFRVTEGGGDSYAQLKLINTSLGDPSVFGTNQWRVHAWNAGDGTLSNPDAWTEEYCGSYTSSVLNINTTTHWNENESPSKAVGYVGNPVNYDNHSFSAKRQGFPVGFYKLKVDGHDDAAQLFVNDNLVWEHDGCCDTHDNLWEGALGASDKIEFRVTDAFGGSSGLLTFVPLVSTAAAALNFDGVDDYVSTATQMSAPTTFTLEAWFKTTSVGGGIVGFNSDQTDFNSGAYDRFIFVEDDGKVSFGVYTGELIRLTSPIALNDGNYHHVAATCSPSGGLRLYVDGQLVVSNTNALTFADYQGYWRIGGFNNWSSTNCFTGNIDEVRIWNRALSAAEIAHYRTCELPSSAPTGLTNYYKFNKGMTYSNNTALNTTLPDASGFANNGTLNNFNLTGVTSNWVGPGGVTIGATCSTILPVDLLRFSGKNTEGGNLLTWATAEEKNVRDFEVERSSDGQNFEKIGTLKAKGFNSNYEFIDQTFGRFETFRRLYYRLTINDLDGEKDFSKIISIEKTDKKRVKIYPSVTSGVLSIENAKSFEIVNSVGQVVERAGIGYFENIRYLNLSHLPTGIYFIKGVDTEGGIFTQKIIKN